MIKKLKAALAVILLICLCGCSATDEGTLLQAPRPLGEGEGIKAALEVAAKGKISYKYPLSGEYRSAIILKDIDEDEKDEAIAFYKSANTADESVHISMLDYVDGDWLVINDLTGPGAAIDKVLFCNLDGNRGIEVVVGWSLYSNLVKAVKIYSFSGAAFEEVPTSYLEPETLNTTDITYNEFVCGDFDNDSKDEIVTLELASAVSQTPAAAKLIEYYTNSETGKPFSTVTWTANMDSTVTSYVNVRPCYINEASSVTNNISGSKSEQKGLFAVVVDGLNSQNQMVTDIVCWDSVSGNFSSPFYDSVTATTPAFIRNSAIISQDINGDGLIELPSAALLPAYTEENEEKMYMISWNRYVNDTESRLVPVMNTVYNADSGYYIVIPDNWLGQVTAKLDKTSNTLYFYTYDYKFQSFGTELFRIHECDKKEFKKLEEQDFIKLSTVGDKIYCALLQAESPEQFNINRETVSSIFRLSNSGVN